MSRLSIPLLYIKLGEPFIVTLIFFMSGKMYFSESLAPAAYDSMNSKRIPFNDRLWALTFTYPLLTREITTGRERLNPNLPKEIKSSLGNSAQQILKQDQNSLKAQRQRLAEVENQERVAQARAVERGQEIAVKRGQIAEQIQNLARQSERARARIDAIQEEEQGTNLENEAELNRQKQLLKNYESDLEGKKKKN